MAMITDPDVYFEKGCGRCEKFDTPDCATKKWATGLAELRRIALDEGLEEVAKWGHPCYMAHDRNIILFGAFKDEIRLNFMRARLLKDPEGVLTPSGPNSVGKEVWRFDDNDAVAEQEATIRAYIREAVDYAERGLKPEKIERKDPWPDELTTALDDDPELAEAFDSLTPGRQRSYLINLNSAKQSETRVRRIEKFRDRILVGKGATEY